MNEILDRFARIEHLVSQKNQSTEILCADGRIIMRTGKGNAAAGCWGCATIWGGWAFVLLMAAWSFVVAYRISVAAFGLFTVFVVMCLGGLGFYLWKWSSENGSFRQYKIFEIDTLAGTIRVPKPSPFYSEGDEQIKIEDIYCFYGWHMPYGEDEDYVYAVDKKDQTMVICERLIPVDKTAQILGFLCDKPVYRRDHNGKISPLTEMFSN